MVTNTQTVLVIQAYDSKNDEISQNKLHSYY